MSIAVQPLLESRITAAANSLSKAFMDDPLQSYVFPDAEERMLRSPAHFEALLRYGTIYGEVYTTQNAEGAVVWLPPGETEIIPEKAEKGGLTKLPELLGEEATHRFFTVMDFLEPFHKLDAPEPHWYTMVIGVAPSFCGMGNGKALMNTVIDKAKRTQTPIYLETAAPFNISFYKNIGFSIIREFIEPTSQLPLWTFKKEF